MREAECCSEEGRSWLAYVFFFLLGVCAAIYFSGRGSPGVSAREAEKSPDIAVHQGGDFEYIPIPLEEPLDRLPDTDHPLGATRWYFPHYTPEQLRSLLKSCKATHEIDSLLDSSQWTIPEDGIVIHPDPEVVLNLDRRSRESIYGVLARSHENRSQCDPFRFRPEKFGDWCNSTGLGPEQLSLFRKLTYMRGGSVCFCDGPVLQHFLERGDFKCMVRALYGERTFLMRLVIKRESDIDGIIQYWSKGGSHVEDLRPLFRSMAKVPGGTSINVSVLLPTFARTRLYRFAHHGRSNLATNENCFWTAMNFFRDTPDPRFVNPQYTKAVLASEYSTVSEAPTYGDLILLTDSEGHPLHLSVYLADSVVFTKNGGDDLQPWVLMKIPDMRAYYNAKEPAQMIVCRKKESPAQSGGDVVSPAQAPAL